MATPAVTVPNFAQYNFEVNDTVKVIEKQNGVNAALESFGKSLNQSITAFNKDVDAVNKAKEELNVDQLVHAPGSGLPNEAGEAYRRGVVGGEGDLMVQGFAGVGAIGSMQVLPAIDITTIPSGDYVVQGVAVEQRPPGASGFAYISIDRYNSNNIRIEYSPIGSQSTGNRKWWTTYNSTTGAFLPWVEIFTTGNIVGAVSMVNGVPAGAVIERGSNSLGRWVKLADGTMICWMEREFSFNTLAWQNMNFPQPFSSRPSLSHSFTGIDPSQYTRHAMVSVCSHGGASDHLLCRSMFQTAGTTLTLFDTTETLLVTAYGRWYE